ncbi:helix-turn-helix domain-containing protein [uncultured Draconibacterium sp.]|uniref:helix-turn-helix domain-containing protein n=1 Tax=uncultured Draconibacterium sp. TaxID=1573823 RepID=UPI0025D14566|nr:helix-turn-helix domain-containing protein [uncultured Draconibacterium sp.]
MSDTSVFGADFIKEAEAIILENISNEHFGVSELADLMHMSRSSLLRKIKTHTQLSASQFIRKVRVTKALELLQQNSLTVAEVSYQVGFSNTSYFIKCFRDEFAYSPGEIRKGKQPEEQATLQPTILKKYGWYLAASLVISIVLVLVFLNRKEEAPTELEKSIAVLPFKNESSDTLNLYFVNGLMESTLNKLQKIGDLRVVSRTSSARYRNTQKNIREIAEELNVNYLVEGSGQRFGNQVLLNIQLIEASSDRPIWGEQYSREINDVFALQNEVAQKIANAIKAVVTADELLQIQKIPTKSLEAYDYYLQALDYYYSRTKENLETAIGLFQQAIELDEEFALAYANIAISYYFLDLNQVKKQHTERINTFADKALLYDSKLAESLIAKALYYLQIGEYELTVPHLEKALEYNPNSSAVVQMLGDLYARVIPNTDKYLEYALKGIQLDIAANDSVMKGYTYLHLSNALVQNGFVEEATTYINLALQVDSTNYYAPMLKAFIVYAKNGNTQQTKSILTAEWEKDTTRLDILQEVAKMHYYEEDYDSAFYYYEKFVHAREKFGLDIYQHEDIKIAWVYRMKGREKEAAAFLNTYNLYCEEDKSIYKSASLATKYAFEGQNKKALEQLRIFATQDNYQYWLLLFIEKEPIFKALKNNPEFENVIEKIKDRFWQRHQHLKKLLANKNLI